MRKTLVVFSGAGLSQESGIPTFRDSDGLWHNHKVEDVATMAGWKRDKEKVLKFYEDRFHNIKNAEPNGAHTALALLEEKYRVIHITQNIDDLLERAGCSEVIHLHGSILKKKCEKCDKGYDGYAVLGEKCECGNQLRPSVVWFGEAVNIYGFGFIELARHKTAYGIIGVGTSGMVQPAASILTMFNYCKEKHFVDPNPPMRLYSWKLWRGKATEEMPKLVKELMV